MVGLKFFCPFSTLAPLFVCVFVFPAPDPRSWGSPESPSMAPDGSAPLPYCSLSGGREIKMGMGAPVGPFKESQWMGSAHPLERPFSRMGSAYPLGVPLMWTPPGSPSPCAQRQVAPSETSCWLGSAHPPGLMLRWARQRYPIAWAPPIHEGHPLERWPLSNIKPSDELRPSLGIVSSGPRPRTSWWMGSAHPR